MDDLELKCDTDYFFDVNVSGCQSCKDICDPNRLPTSVSCQFHCSAYLQKITTQKTTEELSITSSADSNSAAVVVLVVLVLLTAIVLITTCCYIAKRRCQRRELYDKSVESDPNQIAAPLTHLTKNNHPDDSGCASLSRNHNYSDITASVEPFESCQMSGTEPLSSRLISVSQETQSPSHNEEKMSTWLKEIVNMQVTDVMDMEPREVNDDSSAMYAVAAEPVRAEMSIDLQEDFDYVEQAFDLPRRGRELVALSNYSCSTEQMRNFRIIAALQRLAWVHQFWWDSEGAKVVVDDVHQQNGKNEIKEILRREGIPSQEFRFELVNSH